MAKLAWKTHHTDKMINLIPLAISELIKANSEIQNIAQVSQRDLDKGMIRAKIIECCSASTLSESETHWTKEY